MITPFGSTREYFGDRVVYARPGRVGRDRRAPSARAGSQGPDPGLAGFVGIALSLAGRRKENGGGV